MVGLVIGGVLGAFFGSSLGIVGMGGGINGMLPLAIVGGIVGFLVQKTYGKAPTLDGTEPPKPESDIKRKEYSEDSWQVKATAQVLRIILIVGLGYIAAIFFGG